MCQSEFYNRTKKSAPPMGQGVLIVHCSPRFLSSMISITTIFITTSFVLLSPEFLSHQINFSFLFMLAKSVRPSSSQGRSAPPRRKAWRLKQSVFGGSFLCGEWEPGRRSIFNICARRHLSRLCGTTAQDRKRGRHPLRPGSNRNTGGRGL